MSACLALESPLKIAFLGPNGTFTHAAALKHFGHAAITRPMATIDEVFREVEAGSAHYGVVPVENSSEGVVNHTLDCFINSGLKIIGEVELRIHHNLLVAEGTPEDLRQHPTSHTGLALRDYDGALGMGPQAVAEKAAWARRPDAVAPLDAIQIVNAKEHNLQNLSVDIPRGKFNVVTGVSGSGKSTLAFDILFNEGQRRYLESLNAYARSIVQPAAGPRWMRSMAFHPRWPSSSGCRAAAARARWAPPPRSGISCGCCM